MTYGIQHKMIRSEIFLLVSFASLTFSIRVDWNTNTGPIVPPTSTATPVPKLPFREPAPVWEDQSDDVPNPNPYRYVLPPPSRPKFVTDNYLRAPISPQAEYNYQQQQKQLDYYGQVISLYPENVYYNHYNNFKIVPSLAAQFIPNIGLKYSAIVPRSPAKSYYLKENNVYDDKFSKLNGIYNPKLKKYKYYQKLYVPRAISPVKFGLQQQELPREQQAQPFNIQPVNTSTNAPIYQQPSTNQQQKATDQPQQEKHVYPKQQETSKSKITDNNSPNSLPSGNTKSRR